MLDTPQQYPLPEKIPQQEEREVRNENESEKLRPEIKKYENFKIDLTEFQEDDDDYDDGEGEANKKVL